MGKHNASVQHSYTVEIVISGSGPHVVRTYPKKAGVVIPFGGIAAMSSAEAIEFDPSGDLAVKGIATKAAAADDVSVTLCVLGGVKRELVTVKDNAALDAAITVKLEERHIYCE
ncbi:hypothetical protein [Halodesulfovibrio sp. MK-HDV]|jgi:hypothetical protein|uniref:hypothetical protein n=1 Tax=Halodesulfovibrio sp. MK-HDV TaxID=2599925 RepID=UPI00136A4C9B|nr:hypothetical protein [Halodesulfovibrio sp. MK-HDV]KAF1073250.1 hypothetical protein MKHDV_03738 [Halodesulfovibrio sp. MK-HDV]